MLAAQCDTVAHRVDERAYVFIVGGRRRCELSVPVQMRVGQRRVGVGCGRVDAGLRRGVGGAASVVGKQFCPVVCTSGLARMLQQFGEQVGGDTGVVAASRTFGVVQFHPDEGARIRQGRCRVLLVVRGAAVGAAGTCR